MSKDWQDGFNAIMEAVGDAMLKHPDAEEPTEGADGTMNVVINHRAYSVEVSGGSCVECGSTDACGCFPDEARVTG
jgi:hypothetical protein